MLGLRKRKAKAEPADELATVLLQFRSGDAVRVRDVLNGGVAVFGRTGSGKSSGSGRALAASLVDLPGSGGLILAAKPEDRAFWVGLFDGAGRGGDLVVFGPAGEHRFNFLDYEARAGGHARNITRTIMVIGESLRSSGGKGGGEDGDFWERQQERLIYNAVVVLKLSLGRVTAPDLQRFVTGAAQSPQQLASDEWRAGFHNTCLGDGFKREKAPVDASDFDLAMDYWLGEFPGMADRTRSSILAGVLGILHAANTGIVRELVSAATTVTPEDMFAGKWVLVDMPPAEWGDMGSFVAAGWKYLTQRAVLRRHAEAGDGIVVLWSDEAQQFVNSYDAHYLAQCRSHRGCMVYLTQSLHSYYAALKGQAGRHEADALLANFHHKVFHALGDVQTAEWASALVGRSLQVFVGGSTSHGEADVYSLVAGGPTGQTGSFSEHYEHVLQPNVFLSGLRTGGPANGFRCDAILVRTGEPFTGGESWLKVTFAQR